MTIRVFHDDAYAKECSAKVISINDRGGLLLDRTVFYATSGGQTGDCGDLVTSDGTAVPVGLAVYDENRQIVHVPALPPIGQINVGDQVSARLNWDTRYRHMRMHTCLHLLCSLIPFPVTGGSIAAEAGRLDFDIPEAALNKEDLTDQLNALIAADHPVTVGSITDEELEANPDLVRTMAVKPPVGSGTVRLIEIGKDGEVDLQPCGGTHVNSTAEIGSVLVSRIEKKGRQNRRVRVVFA